MYLICFYYCSLIYISLNNNAAIENKTRPACAISLTRAEGVRRHSSTITAAGHIRMDLCCQNSNQNEFDHVGMGLHDDNNNI